MKRDYKGLIALAVTGALALPTAAFATNGYFSHGYGLKSKALAGGGSALPQDAMAAADNPAGMVWVDKRTDLGAAVFSPTPRKYTSTGAPSNQCASPTGPCTFSIGPQSLQSENDYFLIPHFGLNWMLSPDSSVGVSVYGNGGMNTEWEGGTATFFVPPALSFQTFPGTYGGGAGGNPTAGVNLAQLFVNGSYSRKFAGGKASWGVSAIFAYQKFSATGLSSFSAFSLDPSSLTDRSDDDSTGYGGKLGIMGHVTPTVTLAASYQTKMEMGEFDKYKGLFAEQGDFDIPSTFTVGLAWKVTPKSALTADVQQIMYTDVASVSNPIKPLTDGSCTPGNPFAGVAASGAGCLGGSAGAGFGWEDMTIFKLGYQWETAGNWTWRVGISTGDQPIPSSETVFNILAPAVMEEHLTFGFTKLFSPNSEISFAAMYAPNNELTGTNTFDPGQQIKLEMSQWELGASWGYKF